VTIRNTRRATVINLKRKAAKNIVLTLQGILKRYKARDISIDLIIADHGANFKASAELLEQIDIELL
jgi:hypothetical protein